MGNGDDDDGDNGDHAVDNVDDDTDDDSYDVDSVEWWVMIACDQRYIALEGQSTKRGREEGSQKSQSWPELS